MNVDKKKLPKTGPWITMEAWTVSTQGPSPELLFRAMNIARKQHAHPVEKNKGTEKKNNNTKPKKVS
jgi:hypothetical protein